MREIFSLTRLVHLLGKRSVDLVEKASRPRWACGAPVCGSAERRIDHYKASLQSLCAGFSAARPEGRVAENRQKRRAGVSGAAFLAANPSLRRGKPGGGGTKSTDRKPAGVRSEQTHFISLYSMRLRAKAYPETDSIQTREEVLTLPIKQTLMTLAARYWVRRPRLSGSAGSMPAP